jgi:hypothetical protein
MWRVRRAMVAAMRMDCFRERIDIVAMVVWL